MQKYQVHELRFSWAYILYIFKWPQFWPQNIFCCEKAVVFYKPERCCGRHWGWWINLRFNADRRFRFRQFGSLAIVQPPKRASVLSSISQWDSEKYIRRVIFDVDSMKIQVFRNSEEIAIRRNPSILRNAWFIEKTSKVRNYTEYEYIGYNGIASEMKIDIQAGGKVIDMNYSFKH